MNTSTAQVTLTIQISPDQRRALKTLAAKLDQPIRALLTAQIEELLRRQQPADRTDSWPPPRMEKV